MINLKKMKLCSMSLPFASRAERGVILDIHNKKPFEIACKHTVFKFENDFKSNMKIILARDLAFKSPLPQISGSSRVYTSVTIAQSVLYLKVLVTERIRDLGRNYRSGSQKRKRKEKRETKSKKFKASV